VDMDMEMLWFKAFLVSAEYILIKEEDEQIFEEQVEELSFILYDSLENKEDIDRDELTREIRNTLRAFVNKLKTLRNTEENTVKTNERFEGFFISLEKAFTANLTSLN